ncbi:hypothetical protein [Luteibacter sp.]|uniref:hypothetical protein n=1 Tax=Luteibacter sp. TaxID=1886636 RepID=UPI0025C514FF|nr:hypothetical protein [Luteibacter sp.]
MREKYELWANEARASGRAQISWDIWQAAFQAGVQHEREKCAQSCDAMATEHWRLYKGRSEPIDKACMYNPHTEGISDGAALCAEEIRARSKPEDSASLWPGLRPMGPEEPQG